MLNKFFFLMLKILKESLKDGHFFTFLGIYKFHLKRMLFKAYSFNRNCKFKDLQSQKKKRNKKKFKTYFSL